MSTPAQDVDRVAEEYYDSSDADNFYALIWGGEDIHVGLYDPDDMPIKDASRRTVAHMAAKLNGLGRDSHVLDIGAGYGGAARFLVKEKGCRVTCLNISEVENARNEKLNQEQGLADRIQVDHGSFEDIPEPDASFDVVWSQDAILHSGNRRKVLSEVARVLKPGGIFVFTDPMQADQLDDPSALQPVYDRIHLKSLASIGFYRKALAELGFEELDVEERASALRHHYARVAEELESRRGDLEGKVSEGYIDRMLTGLRHWVNGADKGLLTWGVLVFRKG